MIILGEDEIMECMYYISPDGSDQDPGSLEKPFRTIEKARDTLREIKRKTVMTEDVTVFLRGGTYNILKAIEFTEGDSGENDHIIIYRNYPGEEPILTGSVNITGWEPSVRGGVNDLWECGVPDISNTRQLFINGQRLPRARSQVVKSEGWKKHDDPDMQFHKLIEEFEAFQGLKLVYEGYKTPLIDMIGWGNKKDIEFSYDVGWTHSICPVEDIYPFGDEAFVKMQMPCFRDCQIKGGVQIGSPNYIENAFELLDSPGEWYLDRTRKMIYCIPPEGVNLRESDTLIPVTEQLLIISGQLDRPVNNLRFEGIVFEHTTWLRPGIEGHPEIQANLVKNPMEDKLLHSCFLKAPSAVVIDAARNVTVEGCTFRKLGSGALDIQNGSNNILIQGNHIYDISGSGIQIGDFNHTDAHPEDEREIVREIRIQNNHLHDIGIEFKGSIGVNAGYVQDTYILHNNIHDVAYSGISVGWGWGFWDPDGVKRTKHLFPDYYPRYDVETVAKRNHIEYNHVHHVMTRLHDGGGIYTLSLQPGSTIQGNCVHDNGGYPEQKCVDEVLNNLINPERLKQFRGIQGFPGGIYLDEASGGFTVSDNIVYGVPVGLFYHDIGIPGRFETNQILDNYFGEPMVTGGFGVEEHYQRILQQR